MKLVEESMQFNICSFSCSNEVLEVKPKCWNQNFDKKSWESNFQIGDASVVEVNDLDNTSTGMMEENEMATSATVWCKRRDLNKCVLYHTFWLHGFLRQSS